MQEVDGRSLKQGRASARVEHHASYAHALRTRVREDLTALDDDLPEVEALPQDGA